MPAMKNVRMKSQQKHFIALTKTRMKFQDGWTQSIKSFFKEIALRDSIRAFYACFFTGERHTARHCEPNEMRRGNLSEFQYLSLTVKNFPSFHQR